MLMALRGQVCISVFVFAFFSLIGGVEPVEGLESLSTDKMRNVTGAEGLAMQTDQVLDNVKLKPDGSDKQYVADGPLVSNSLPRIQEDGREKPLISLNGNVEGIRTRYLTGSPDGSSNIRRTNVDASGPFYLDMEITPARSLVSPASSPSQTSLKLPELSGSTGGDFVINSPGEINSTGEISIGGLSTAARVDIRTPPATP